MNASQGSMGDSASSLARAKKSRGTLEDLAEVAGRVLMAALFLLSGLGKLGAYAATAAYMSSAGIPGVLLPAVIATEVLGAVAVILGWKARIAAFLIAGFSLLAAIGFHRNLANQMEMIQFLKDVSIAGGFLLLVVNGPGRLSIDRRLAA
jgi:putative oxidoreductase